MWNYVISYFFSYSSNIEVNITGLIANYGYGEGYRILLLISMMRYRYKLEINNIS